MTLSFTAILPIILVFVLYFLGLPIVYALFGSPFFYFLFVNEGVQPWTILQKVMNSTQSFWGLFFPFGIILGIRFAIFTPAEGGVSVLFMNHLAYRCYGEVGVSALSVITYLQFLIEAVFMGFTTSVEPVFSYHYGSGNIPMRKKVYRYSIQWCFLLGAVLILVLFLLRGVITGIYFKPDTEFYRISLQGYMISLPACLFIGYNSFGSGLFTAFSNGLISGFLSLVRTFAALILCLFVLTALFSGYGLWSAWPAAELISLIVTAGFLRKYREKYEYA